MINSPLSELRDLNVRGQRPAAVLPENEDTDKSTSRQINKLTNLQTNELADKLTNNPTNKRTNKQADKLTPSSVSDQSQPMAASNVPMAASTPRVLMSAAEERALRIQELIDKTSDDPVMMLSGRVSTRLNDYLEEYTIRMARLNPRKKLRKQDVMAMALAAFIVDNPLPETSVDL